MPESIAAASRTTPSTPRSSATHAEPSSTIDEYAVRSASGSAASVIQSPTKPKPLRWICMLRTSACSKPVAGTIASMRTGPSGSVAGPASSGRSSPAAASQVHLQRSPLGSIGMYASTLPSRIGGGVPPSVCVPQSSGSHAASTRPAAAIMMMVFFAPMRRARVQHPLRSAHAVRPARCGGASCITVESWQPHSARGSFTGRGCSRSTTRCPGRSRRGRGCRSTARPWSAPGPSSPARRAP